VVSDDRGRDLRAGDGIHRDQGFAGDFRGFALPPQRKLTVRTESR
jgi:hypothetical protein